VLLESEMEGLTLLVRVVQGCMYNAFCALVELLMLMCVFLFLQRYKVVIYCLLGVI
jgi:hypothetical protein